MAGRPRRSNSFSLEVDKFTKDLRHSLLLREDIPTMLELAPATLSLLGHCRMMSFADDAAVTLSQPDGGFQYLKYDNLPACLTQLSSQGQRSFEKAEANLGSISFRTEVSLFGASGSAQTIMRCLVDPKLAKGGLSEAMAAFQDTVQECASEAEDIRDEFKKWQSMAMELNAAAAGEENNTRDKAHAAMSEKVQIQAYQDQSKIRAEQYAKELESLRQEYDHSRELYRDAVKHQSPYRDVGIGLLTGFSNSIFKVIGGAVDVARNLPNVALGLSSALGGSIPQSAFAAIDATPTERIHYPGPGLRKADAIFELVDELQGLVDDKLADLLAHKQDKLIPGARARIQSLKESLTGNKDRASKEGSAILKDCEEIFKEILRSRDVVRHISFDRTKWNVQVTGWQRRLQDVYGLALKLKTTADGQSGEALVNDVPQLSRVAIEGTNDFATAMNKRYATLLTKQETMMRWQELVATETDKKREAEIRSNQLAHDLENLEINQKAMVSIRATLKEAISVVSQLQTQVGQLTNYFHSLLTVAKEMQRTSCPSFMRAIEAGLEKRKDGWHFAVSEIHAQEILTQLLAMRGHFSCVNDGANLYREVSRDYITPFMVAINALPLDLTDDERREERKKLVEDSKEAAKAIRKKAEERHSVLLSTIRNRVQEIQEEIDQLPFTAKAKALSATQVASIKEGGKESAKAMRHKMDANEPVVPSMAIV